VRLVVEPLHQSRVPAEVAGYLAHNGCRTVVAEVEHASLDYSDEVAFINERADAIRRPDRGSPGPQSAVADDRRAGLSGRCGD
jgi:hypothetical protein